MLAAGVSIEAHKTFVWERKVGLGPDHLMTIFVGVAPHRSARY